MSVVLWKFDNDTYVQIGLIMLIGLSAKNAILIVEVARELHDRDGLSIIDAARAAAKVRFRPILMTSFAFSKSDGQRRSARHHHARIARNSNH